MASAAVTAYKASKIVKAARVGEDLSKMKPVGRITSNIAGNIWAEELQQVLEVR